MKYLTCGVAVWLTLALGSFASPTREEVLKAVAILEQPEKNWEALADAAQQAVTFGNDSEDVSILVSKSAAPWLTEKWKLGEAEIKAVRLLLVGSYVAGSIKYQLTEGKADMNPYHGWLLANRTYKIIKPKWGFVSPGAEKLCALEQQGKLKAYAAEVMKEE